MSTEKRRRSKVNEFGDHKVTFTVTIAKAFPTDENEMKPSTRGLAGIKGRRRIYEAPKPQFYYHMEYKLLPDESDPLKTDVVTYGVAAKVYIESDSKIMKTWVEGKKTWIAWTHSHTITVTKDILLKLYDHTLELRIWDSKDKVSPRARFDRPKAFRLPVSRGPEELEDPTGVKQMVAKQLMSFESLQPKPSVVFPGDLDEDGHSLSPSRMLDKKDKALTAQRPSTFHSTAVSLSESASAAGMASMVQVQVRVDDRNTPQFSRMAYLAGVSPPVTTDELKEMELSRAAKRDSVSRKKSHGLDEESHQRTPIKKNSKQPTKKELALAAHARIYGTASVSIKMSTFFAGTKSVTNRIEKAAGNIEDLLVSVTLDEELLSEMQKRILNPMVINVTSASSLPNRPLSYKRLREKCKPVHLLYQFYKQPSHQSAGREHGREVYWQDVNVILLGTLDKAALSEYLQGPHFEIEVHDRDRKVDSKKPKPSLFGENTDDDMINNVSLVAGRRTTHNPFEGRENPWDPYGVAKFDLSGLLLGQRVLHLRSPIHCCPLPETNTGHEKPSGPIVGRPGNVDGPEEAPLPTANYLEAGSELKVRFELAYPLNALEEKIKEIEKAAPRFQECPFGRIVYIFEYSNAKFLRQLQAEITAINSEALELDSLPVRVIEAALSTYKLSAEQRKSKSQDIITGFQVLDGRFHMFVLEGLAAKGIKRLWTKLPRPQEEDPSKFNVLYNSDMSFHERLYASLDVDLCRVRLHEPLTIIMQNPLLYVRDLVPKPCFEALAKLDTLLKVTKLRDATRSDLFPSADMVISMSREFGVPLTAEDFGELESETAGEAGQVEDENMDDTRPKTSRLWTPLELRNPAYVRLLKERRQREGTQDFIRDNILRTRTTEPKQRPHTIAMDLSELHVRTSHNYSIQSLNSTELAKEKLRQVLTKENDRRFTYCPQYNSATVLPVHPETVKKQDLLESQRSWRTTHGFIYPGKKTSLESNEHQKKPDSSRVDELRKPWKENVLHANILKPTVGREQFPWPERHKDLDLLSRPPPFFDKDPVISVHAAGDTKEKEILDAIDFATTEWRDKVVVDDAVFRTHRCLTETELQSKGRKASNQLDKLQGLLKNEPHKHSLGSPGFSLREVPALAVVLDPSLDTTARKTGKLLPLSTAKDRGQGEKSCGFYPGPYESEGWLLEKNKVPIHDREHSKFEELNGKDFRLFYNKTDVLSRRPIEPLKASERETHLFAAVADTCS